MAFDETYNEPESTEVLVKSLDPEHPAQLHYAHAGDAGADLITTVDVTLKPFERALVPTGVAIALPAGYVALVHPRSGLAAKQGVTVLNAPGTVDAGQGASDQPRSEAHRRLPSGRSHRSIGDSAVC